MPSANKVIVTTDDPRIVDAVQTFGGQAFLTSPGHLSGTDHLIEVMKQMDADIYINLQGNETLVRPEDIEQLTQGMLADTSVDVGTRYHTIEDEEAVNPNMVKVVLGHQGNGIYFSRSSILYPRETNKHPYSKKHVAVYCLSQAGIDAV